MTYQDAWLDTVYDDEFKATVDECRSTNPRWIDRVDRFPDPADRHIAWVPETKAWATRHGFQIEYVDNQYLKIPVSRSQALQFLDDIYTSSAGVEVQRMREFIWRQTRNDRKYLIVAEEF